MTGPLDQRDDRRHLSSRVPGRQRDERVAPLRMQSTHDEVGGPAEPGVDAPLDTGGVRLPVQIDLQRRVHADHGRRSTDPARVVGRLGAAHPHPAVAVEPVVEALTAEDEGGGQRHIGVEAPQLVQWQHAVGEHLRPDLQPSPTGQRGQHRVRYSSDAQLQGRTIGDFAVDPARDGFGHLVGISRRQRHQGLFDLDAVVDVVHVDDGVAVGVRHLGVHLRDDQAATITHGLEHRREDVDLEAHRHHPVARSGRV